ncbi:MAG: hypothetical protein ACTSRP_08680 [Candidatus Helarchaeota archaeon]
MKKTKHPTNEDEIKEVFEYLSQKGIRSFHYKINETKEITFYDDGLIEIKENGEINTYTMDNFKHKYKINETNNMDNWLNDLYTKLKSKFNNIELETYSNGIKGHITIDKDEIKFKKNKYHN